MTNPDKVALAFGLGDPEGDLVHIRRGDSDAWRLNTSTGSYFVKGYLSDEPTGELAMTFEQRALDAGVDMPTPIPPIDPLLGWLTRIDGRLFRAYRWIETAHPDRDVSTWLGRTMARVHQLQPLDQVGLPEWWRQAIHSPATWSPKTRDKPWASLYDDAVPHLVAVSERIAELSDLAPDQVMTHGDFKPHNIVHSPTGPVLVDWDSVRSDSAALEASRVAYTFGTGDHEQISKILTAYVEAGGELAWPGPDLFLSVARHDLQVLGELIPVAVGEAPAARWMGDFETTITDKLRDLPGKLDHLRELGQRQF